LLFPPEDVLGELRRRLHELDTPPGRLDQFRLEKLTEVLIQPFCEYFLPAWLRSALPGRETCDRATIRIEIPRLRDAIIGEIVGNTLDEISLDGIVHPVPPPAWEDRPPLTLRLGTRSLSRLTPIKVQISARHGYLEREIPYRFRHVFRRRRQWVFWQLMAALPATEIETIAFMYPAAAVEDVLAENTKVRSRERREVRVVLDTLDLGVENGATEQLASTPAILLRWAPPRFTIT
jgi:hypothetical protein